MRLFLFLLLALPLPALAQPCAPAESETFLEGAGVRALTFNNGALFWRGGDHVYEVPRDSGRQALFAADLWLSGTVDGEPRFSGSDFGPYEYWPGPLAEDGSAPTAASCAEHDRIWSVGLPDIAAYNETGTATDDLREWPAHLGAPVVDGDGIADNYNLAGGDRPNVYGGHVLWWIMNDLGGPHDWSETPGLGVEVRVTASATIEGMADTFEPGSPLADLVRYATHYRYEIVHRGTETVEDVHVGMFVDADLGDAGDDLVGTDPATRMVYTYNGDDLDGGVGYGDRPPAIGFVAGRPPEGVVTRGSYLAKNPPGSGPSIAVSDGSSAAHVLRGLLRDGSRPWTFGETGLNPANPTTDWTFPDFPGQYWSMMRSTPQGDPIMPSDKRMMISQGPYTLAPGDGFTFEVAIPWARSETSGAIGSVRKLLQESAPLAGSLPIAPPADLATILPGDPRVRIEDPVLPPALPERFALEATSWPNPVRETAVIRYDAPAEGSVRLAVYDALGREVAVLLDGPTEAGFLGAPLDARRLAPGVYTYRMSVDGEWLGTTGRFTVIR